MRILVLVKQVSEPETPFELVDGRVSFAVPPRFRMNSYDEYALEAALELAQTTKGEVTALSVGPASAVQVLERAAGMGAGRCVHLLNDQSTDLRPSQLAQGIASWFGDQTFDLILAGMMSEDAMQGAVGPMLAARLGLPLATSVVELSLPGELGQLRAVREMEGGQRQVLGLPLPAVVTVQSGINQPRYPTLSNLLKAKKNKPHTVLVSSLAMGPAREEPMGLAAPVSARDGLVLSGATHEKAATLLAILRRRNLL